VPGHDGSAIVQADSAKVTRVDGTTGAISWQYYQTPNTLVTLPNAQPNVTMFIENIAEGSGIQNAMPCTACGNHGYFTALDSTTGAVVLRLPLPIGHSRATEAGVVLQDLDTGVGASPIQVLTDGTVSFLITTSNDTAVTTSASLHSYTYKRDINWVRVDTMGNLTVTNLQDWSVSFPPCGLCNNIVGTFYPGSVIPDGQGGALALWDFGLTDGTTTTHVTRFDGLGNQIADVHIPLSSFAFLGTMLLGDNNNAFVTNSTQVVAFDVNTGAILWGPWNAPSGDQVKLLAAEWGGGVIVRDTQPNGGEQLIRLDLQGNPIPQGWNSLGLQPYFSPALGLWYGVTGTGNSYSLIEQSQLVPASTACSLPQCPSYTLDDMGDMSERKQLPVNGVAPAKLPDCAKPKYYKGNLIPPQADAQTYNTSLYNWLTKLRTKVDNSKLLITPNNTCFNFWNDPKADPRRLIIYQQLQAGVDRQKWFVGELSTISMYDAGAWDWTAGQAAAKALLSNRPVSCQFEPSADGGVEGALSQGHDAAGNNPATDTYYTNQLKYWLILVRPATIVHESIHNLTGISDSNLRVVLGMKAPANPQDTIDIAQKMEDIGCAPNP
jgi:hypothetical protein